MDILKRFFYLAYYFKELDWDKFNLFMRYVSTKHKISPIVLWGRILYSSLRYNISILEYFQFRFYEISDAEKESYAGTGFMYEYQLAMNPKPTRNVLEDKSIFLDEYSPFIKHKHVSLKQIDDNQNSLSEILSNDSGKIVMKNSFGQCGQGVVVLSTNGLTVDSLFREFEKTKNDLIEEFVVQHETLMMLSPSGLNTVRIVTQLNSKNEAEIIGARLRITVNSVVDNMAAGNMAAPINPITGIVEGPGVYSDITKEDSHFHPVTNIKIPGLKIPFWDETVRFVLAAAGKNNTNRSIGWDVAITQAGPELIEGNHDWCKLLWQLPVKRGLKPVLRQYLTELKKK